MGKFQNNGASMDGEAYRDFQLPTSHTRSHLPYVGYFFSALWLEVQRFWLRTLSIPWIDGRTARDLGSGSTLSVFGLRLDIGILV